MTSTRIQHRIDSDLKKEAERILEQQGIKPSIAITILYTEVKRTGGFPFLPSKVPNKKLAKDLRDSAEIRTHKSKKDLFESLDKL